MDHEHTPPTRKGAGTLPDPAHAAGKRHKGPPPEQPLNRHDIRAGSSHRQPWVATSSRVGRQRRSPHG